MNISKKKTAILLFSTVLLSTMLTLRLMNEGNLGEQEHSAAVLGNKSNVNVQLDEDGKSSDILKVSVFVNSSQFSLLQQMSRDFEKQHAGIHVLLDNLSASAAYTSFKALSRTGEASDVMLLDNAWVNEFAVNGYLSHEADKYITSDSLAQNLTTMLNQVKWNGFIWAVPNNVDPYILVWNPGRFAEKNLDHPPATVKELIQINPIFQDAPDHYGLHFDSEDPFALIALVRILGGGKLSVNQQSELQINDQTLERLRQLLSASDQSELNKNTLKQKSDFLTFTNGAGLWDLLKQGNIAMALVKATEFMQYTSENPDSELAVAMLPKLQEDSEAGSTVQVGGQAATALLQGTSFGVSSHSKVTQIAFEWIKTVTSSRQQVDSMKQGGSFPVLKSLYETSPLSSDPDFVQIKEAILLGGGFAANPKLAEKLEMTRSDLKELLQGAADLEQFRNAFNQRWVLIDANS